MRRVLFLAVLWTITVAGCAEPTMEDDGTLDGTLDPLNAARSFAPVSFEAPGGYHHEQWDNGSFSIQDSGWPAGGPVAAATGRSSSQRIFDITDRVPRGVPVEIHVLADATVQSGPWPRGGNIYLFVACDLKDFIHGTVKREGGGHREARVLVQAVSGQPIRVVVGYGSLDPSPAIRFTLHTIITAQNETLPPSMHTALDLQGGDALRLEALEGPLRATLWDPSDQVAATIRADDRFEYVVPAALEGSFVLVNHAEGAPIRVLRNASSPTSLSLLPLEWVPGSAPHPVGPGGASWETTVTRPVLRAGLMFTSADGAYRCAGFGGKIASRGGEPLLRTASADPACGGVSALSPFEWFEQTPVGAPGLLEDTFTVEVTAQDSANLVAREWFRHYIRGG